MTSTVKFGAFVSKGFLRRYVIDNKGVERSRMQSMRDDVNSNKNEIGL